MEQFNYLSGMTLNNLPYNEKTKKYPRRQMYVDIPQKVIQIFATDTTGKRILLEEYRVSE